MEGLSETTSTTVISLLLFHLLQPCPRFSFLPVFSDSEILDTRAYKSIGIGRRLHKSSGRSNSRRRAARYVSLLPRMIGWLLERVYLFLS